MAAVLALAGCGGSGGGGSSSDVVPLATVAPTITAQPPAVTVTAGAAASFAVTASGTPAPTFQWQRNGTAIAGATSASYSIAAPLETDSGALFSVVVSNSAGSVTSAAAALTVNPAPTAPAITSQPVGRTVATGTAANFSVEASGTAPLTFQWQRDGVNIAGATSASYSLATPTLADSGASFRVVVGNAAGSVTSGNALLTVSDTAVAAPTITAQPQSVSTIDGAPVILSVGVSGTGPFSYQWRKGGVAIAGATLSAYATPVPTVADSGAVYSVVVTNGGGSVTSANATVTVNLLPVDIFVTPVATSVSVGQTALFVSLATGSAPISYQWRRNGVAIAGATSATYTTPATTLADDGALYSVVVTNAANSVTSNAARLTVVGAPVAPTIATAPANLSVSEGQIASFTATATGTGPLTYQWRRNAVDIAGATSASYTTAATTTADNGAKFSVRVGNAAGSVVSSEAVLTVQAATGGLVGRGWVAGQLVANGNQEVIDSESVIDDAGRVTTVYMQNNGTRWQLFARRSTPNAAGTAPTWSAPVALDVLQTQAVFADTRYNYFFNISGSPNGNAVAYWTFVAPCTSTTYVTVAGRNCQYVYTARFLASNGAWEAPLSAGGFPGNPGSVRINDRGDIAFVATGGTPATNYPYYTESAAVAWRAAADAGFKSQLIPGSLAKYAVVMDNSGNMLLAGALTQNATIDAVAFRGNLGGGFGAAQVLDTRGAAVSAVTPAMGTGGQQLVTWLQNNGTRTSVFAATSSSASAALVTLDVGINGWDNIFALDNGQILLYYGANRYRWTAGTWGTAEAVPSWQVGSSSSACGFARTGDGVCVAGSGLWASYDAARNVVVQKQNTTSPGAGYLLGFSKSIGTNKPLLSTNGIAYTDWLVKYDVLPTPALPAGDGRDVANLWGFYLK